MRNIRAHYNIEDACEELHCSTRLLRYFLEEGLIRYAFNNKNNIPIEVMGAENIPNPNVPITHDFKEHVYALNDRFIYTSPILLNAYKREQGHIIISSTEYFLETQNGAPVVALVEIDEGYTSPILQIPIDNPIITTHEIERYKKQISRNGPLNIGESSDPAAEVLVYYGNLYCIEFDKIPTAKKLIKYLEEQNLEAHIYHKNSDTDNEPYRIGDIDMDIDAIKKRLYRYKKFFDDAKKGPLSKKKAL